MGKYPKIEGSPYTATFFGKDDGFEGASCATAVIEPPVVLGEPNYLIGMAFSGPRMDIVANHMLTSVNKTAIELCAEDNVGYEHPHEERLDTLYSCLAQFVDLLNRIENGTFDGDT